MTTHSGAASLTSAFTFTPITGFRFYQEGNLDNSGVIRAPGTSRWAALTTWAGFTNYITARDPIRWTAPVIDIGSIDYFCLNIQAEFTGSLYYIIHVSETGVFGGEETEYLIQEGNLNVSAFYGRYVYVTAFITGDSLTRLSITTSTDKSTIKLVNVDTSTCSGTSSNRIIPLTTSVSQIYDINIECKAATSYAVNLYVSDTATSEVLIPVVKSKSAAAPALALYGIDNDPRDGIVDITITALPRMVMSGGNLLVIS
jgi:hypothetical protein